MMMDIEAYNPHFLMGLLIIIGLLAGIIFITSVRLHRCLKHQSAERDREEKEFRNRMERREEERIRLMREEILNSAWIYKVADFVIQMKTPVKRIEIWKNQLIIETERFNHDSLLKFGVTEDLTSEEMYHANKILYELICKKGCHQFCLRDRFSYCEIIKIY